MNDTLNRPDLAETDPANLPPSAADLAALKTAFAPHLTCDGVAEIRAEMLRLHRDRRLDVGTVVRITAWLNDGCAKPASAPPAPAARPLHKGEIVTNTAGQIVRLYLSKTGRLYGKIRNGYGEWEYAPEAMRGARHLTADEAAAYGKATDHCVFCSRALTDERSVTVGYGPDCADRMGLPWGSK